MRVAIYGLLGPPAGGVLFLLVPALVLGTSPHLSMLQPLLVLSYPFGLPDALPTGIAVALLDRHGAGWGRLVLWTAATVIGAVAGLGDLMLVGHVVQERPPPLAVLTFARLGAGAALACEAPTWGWRWIVGGVSPPPRPDRRPTGGSPP